MNQRIMGRSTIRVNCLWNASVVYTVVVCVLFLLITKNFALFKTYPGCADLKGDDFKPTRIASFGTDSVWEPTKLDVWQGPTGRADIYWVERRLKTVMSIGRIRKWEAATGKITTLGHIAVGDDDYGDGGVQNIKLDKDFGKTGWIYVQYTPTTLEANGKWEPDDVVRISRFTIKNNILDLNSETIILEQEHFRGTTGAGMEYDDYGNFYISTGRGGYGEEWSANTNSLAGKILRIRLIEGIPDGFKNWGIGRTYTIPDNNFSPFMAKYFNSLGRTNLARKYADTNYVKPEIFAMGLRNPYALSVDPVRQWASFGDCGPDIHGKVSEEFDVVTEPAFLGWPYYAGSQAVMWTEYSGTTPQTSPKTPNNAKVRVAQSFYKMGVDSLPPAQAGTYSYLYTGNLCALDAPIYRYDPKLASDVKFPPHMHRAWFTIDWSRDSIKVHQLSNDGKEVLSSENWAVSNISPQRTSFIWGKLSFKNTLHFKFGPDGALYYINYAGFDGSGPSTEIYRVDYVGPKCSVAADFVREKVGCMSRADKNYDVEATHHNKYACSDSAIVGIFDKARGQNISALVGNRLVIEAQGHHKVEAFDVMGQYIMSITGNSPQVYDLSSVKSKSSGLVIINVKTEAGSYMYKVKGSR